MLKRSTKKISLFTLAFLLVLLVTPSCVHKSFDGANSRKPNATPAYYPTLDWQRKELSETGIDPVKFKAFVDYTTGTSDKFKTDSVVVIKDGYLVYEHYANGYRPGQRHMLWSFSKGIGNAILGVAENLGYVSRDTVVADYYPEVRNSRWNQITLNDLMHMSSGFDFYEEHPGSIIHSDSIYINYSHRGYKDTALYTAKKPRIYPPGTKFNYSSGECNLAMGVLKKAINNQQKYNSFPADFLFKKLGMNSTVIEQDAAGTFVAGSFGWSSPTDIAKLAYLYLNDGVWNGERIFPADWVDYSLKIAPSLMSRGLVQTKEMRLNQEAYGAYWWLNKKLPMNKHLPYPGTPEDAYLAMGYKGQTLAVIPSLNMIVVRLGNDGLDSKEKIDRAKMLRLLIQSVTSPDPTPLVAHHSTTSSHSSEAFEFGRVSGFFKGMGAIFKNNFGLDDGFVLAPAKDLCSCAYVTLQNKDTCMQNHDQYQLFRKSFAIRSLIQVGPAKFDDKKKSVTVESLAHKATATYKEGLGCKVTHLRAKLRFTDLIGPE